MRELMRNRESTLPASVLAHEFNNVLANLVAYLEQARLDTNASGRAQAHLDAALEVAQKGKDLVKMVRSIARGDLEQAEPIAIGETTREALRLVPSEVNHGLAIECVIDPETPLVAIARSEVYQVITNLIANSCAAVEPGCGKILVVVDFVSLSADHAKLCGGTAGGRYVRILVGDNGHGMSQSVLRHAFDEFFTTKGAEEGTGLGLSIVRAIALRRGGFATICSELGRGTDVTVFLPVAPAFAGRLAAG